MVRPNRNLLQQPLHIRLDDALRLELRRHHIAVKERYRQQIRQVVIRLFLSLDNSIDAVEASAGKVVAELEHLCLNREHLVGIYFVLPDEFDHAMDRGLRVDHSVVLFDGALQDALVPLMLPVDVDFHPQEMVNTQRALDYLQGPLDAASGEKERIHGTECRLCGGETLPL